MKKALFLCDSPDSMARVYGKEELERVTTAYDMQADHPVSGAELLANPEVYRDTEVVFSTWGMPSLSEEEIKTCLPRLEAVMYAAGSVQAFARPFLNLGIKVFSAWAANAIPVVEYTVAAILLANKGFFATLPLKTDREAGKKVFATYRGNYGEKVGLLGLGMIGREVARRLKEYKLTVLYYDPFFPEEKAEEYGVKKASLEEIFESCGVISNHIANLPATVGMLNYTLFSKMRPNAFFLNTGRGAQVVEDDLVRALTEEPARYALLDVTFPEPPEEGHPFYTMPNVYMTPHIAGSAGDECRRMSDYMIKEAEIYFTGGKTQYEVSMKMLETMA